VFKDQRKKFIFFLQAFVFIVLLITAPPSNANTFNSESFTLSNGMQVIVIPNHRAPIISHMLWYKTGAAAEPAGQSGVAHFLEHLLFKGTQKIKAGQFSKIIKSHGGNDNAFTSQDYTAYFQNIAKVHLPLVMEMEADRMRNLALTTDVIKSERDVIIEERRERIDNNAQARFREKLHHTLYKDHPYGTPIIGWPDEMAQLDLNAAKAFYDLWYSPNNAILIVAGDITANELKPLAEKFYSPYLTQPLPQTTLPEFTPSTTEQRIDLEDAQVGVPLIQIIYAAPKGKESLEILSNILGSTSSSRLYNELVIEQKLAIYAGSSYSPISKGPAQFTLYASPTPGTDLKILEQRLKEIAFTIAQNGITNAELNDSKQRLKDSAILDRDSLQGPAMLFGRALTSGFTIDYIESWPERLSNLKVSDIRQSAQNLFNNINNKPVVGILKPAQKNKE